MDRPTALSLLLFILAESLTDAGDLDKGPLPTIHITAPMDGWVLTKQAVHLQFWAQSISQQENYSQPEEQALMTEVHLDGKLALSHALVHEDGMAASFILQGQMTWGSHAVDIYIVDGGDKLLAATSSFYLFNSEGPWPVFTEGQNSKGIPACHDNGKPPPESVGERRLKSAVMLYHKDIDGVYPLHWIEKCLSTILSQTYTDFDVFELNYGSSGESLMFKTGMLSRMDGRGYFYIEKHLESHAWAMNHLLDEIFRRDYDVAFNVNIDDYYAPTRFAEQIAKVRAGADLVSTYWTYINEMGANLGVDGNLTGSDALFKDFDPGQDAFFDAFSLFSGMLPGPETITKELARGHNVMCHPGIAFTRRFWNELATLEPKPQGGRQGSTLGSSGTFMKEGGMEGQLLRLLRYREELPAEDLRLWQRAVLMSDVRVAVVPNSLVYYRLHAGQASKRKVEKGRFKSMIQVADFQSKLRVGILTVCTGKYVKYLESHLLSVASNFLKGHPKFFFIFTDDVREAQRVLAILAGRNGDEIALGRTIRISNRGFPADTLYRYHYFLLREDELLTATDFLYYMDVDLIVKEDILLQEVMPSSNRPLVAVRHPLQDFLGTPEMRRRSTAYLPGDVLRPCYVAGGFVGGRTSDFVAMAHFIQDRIDIDDDNDVVAIWHDESHFNKFFADNPNRFRILPPSYLYPATWDIPYTPRILVQRISHAGNRYANESFIGVGGTMYGEFQHKMGSLGDTLFSVAAAIGFAKSAPRHRRTVLLPITSCCADSHGGLCPHVEDVEAKETSSHRGSWFWGVRRSDAFPRIEFTPFKSSEIVSSLPDDVDSILLFGDFRTQVRVWHPSSKDDVRAAFTLPFRWEQYVKAAYAGIRALFDDEIVCVRLVGNEDIGSRYVSSALSNFGLQESFVFFCDEEALHWCSYQHPQFRKVPRIHIERGSRDKGEALVLGVMSRCRGILVSDSLSWWAAYLGGGTGTTKEVIATHWEGSGQPSALSEWKLVA